LTPRYVVVALNTTMNERLQYELKAWVEGCYARRCGQRCDICRYEHDSAMALAWLRGWRYQGELPQGMEEVSGKNTILIPVAIESR
jgi:hypothetical protein